MLGAARGCRYGSVAGGWGLLLLVVGASSGHPGAAGAGLLVLVVGASWGPPGAAGGGLLVLLVGASLRALVLLVGVGCWLGVVGGWGVVVVVVVVYEHLKLE